VAERAARQPVALDAPGGVKDVEVGEVEARAVAEDDETPLDQRPVEGAPVEAHQHTEGRQRLAQRVEQGRLLAWPAHEELPHYQPSGLEVAEPDQEDVGAGSARQPRRLGVEEHDLFRMNGWRAGHEERRRQRGVLQQAAYVVLLTGPLGDEDLTDRAGKIAPGHDGIDRYARRSWAGWARRAGLQGGETLTQAPHGSPSVAGPARPRHCTYLVGVCQVRTV